MRQKTRTPYTLGEEIANSVTHGLGIVAAIAGLTTLVAFAAMRGDRWHVVGAAVYGTTLVLLYTASTLYHSIPNPPARRVLRVLDHAAIYLLIAGTYTPLALGTLRGTPGWIVLATLWTLAVLGIVLCSLGPDRFRWASLLLYVGMGWSAVAVWDELTSAMDPGGVWLLVAGGLAYTLGIAFYLMRGVRYHHMLWHLMVVVGSVLHFFAVLFYVIPRPV